MVVMTASEQFSLFPVSEFTDRERKPTLRSFMENAQWHATDVPDWSRGVKEAEVSVHSGTAKAALERGGRDYYPVLPRNVAPGLTDDIQANLAHAQFDTSRGIEVSDSVRESAGPGHRASQPNFGVRQDPDGWVDPDSFTADASEMRRGRSLAYVNEGEDVGSTAYVSPPGSFLTAADVDMGLAKGWKPPREHFTSSEMREQGVIPPRKAGLMGTVGFDPRLFEEVHPHTTYTADGPQKTPGGYARHDNVKPNAFRVEGSVTQKDMLNPGQFL